ncbi:MAG: AAA family ATPase [Patescibacteria group bacterium]
MDWNVVGHTEQKKYFQRMMSGGSLAHAYLLHGPQGVGKRMFAGELATALLADSGVALQNNPDCILLQPGVSKETGKPTEIPVEAVREMKKWAYQRPLYGVRKVVLIDDAERMSDAAANTVLKVLEEPPVYLNFLLVSSRSGQLLETITSRCQDVAFRTLEDVEMKTVLASLKMDADDRQLVAAVAAGRPGAALRLVKEKKLPTVAKAIAGLEKMLISGTAERIVFAKKIADDDDALQIVSWWLAWAHAQLVARPRLAAVANGLLDLYNAVSETKYNRRLAVEKFLLELLASA